MLKRAEFLQVIAATAALVIGVLVYLIDRQPGYVYFIPNGFSLGQGMLPLFGRIGHHLPTFVHTYAFILITAAILAPRQALLVPICLAWFVIECLFEVGQHTIIAGQIVDLVPHWFDGVPFLEATAGYFGTGTFDPLDIIAIVLASIAAGFTVRATMH